LKIEVNGNNRPLDIIQRVKDSIAQVIVGKENIIELILTAFLSRGHVLIQDVPGVAKTLIAKTFSAALGLSFSRIQFTPDLLPGDITGLSVFNQKTMEFEFRPGPLFADLILADEINRATPRTQSALLESMEERQVTVDGTTYPMSKNFTILATQNPLELHGTFPLPEAQLDRFLMRISIGYPDEAEEKQVVSRFEKTIVAVDAPALTEDELEIIKEGCNSVYISPEIIEYVTGICRATRDLDGVRLGASPRASLALAKASKSYAYLKGRDYVIPDDVKALASPVLSHRLVLLEDASFYGVSVNDYIQRVLTSLPVPIGVSRESHA
jgi:MoxR-like ATPase